ncbi:MAG: HlyC/CorC family transporter [Actinobacteria bacterium]|nr:HlyC/CorC family transporter [Actinomycetota bacterium]
MTVLLLALVVLLILVNGFFVAAEFALVRSRRSRMEELSKAGSKRAARALKQMERIDEYVAACQVGITLASIGIGFLGEPAIASLLEPLLGDVFSHGVATVLAFIITYAIITYSHVLAGEQAPKMMGIARAEPVLLWISRPLDLFRSAFSPLIYATNAPARLFVGRVLGWEISAESEAASSEELQVLISHSAVGGDLDPGEAGMLRGVFHLHEQEAREVMTPIPAVVTVDASSNVSGALELCYSSGHNRLVVIEDGNQDRVRGIVHALRLTRLLMEEGNEAPIEPAIREALIVPETKPLDDLLTELQRQRSSMGVVVDEYGRNVGVVTVEDILEEVVGEIEDETDPLAGAVRQLANGDWYVRGHVSLGDLGDRGIELPVDTDAFNSIGGYVFDELGRLPKRGDLIAADGYEIRVESVRENRIEAVRIHPRPKPPETA